MCRSGGPVPEQLDLVDETAPRDVGAREAESAAAGGVRLRAAVDAELIVDEHRHPGDRLPVGRRADRMRDEIVSERREHDVAVGVHDDVEPQMKPRSLREALARTHEDTRSFRRRSARDDAPLAEHDAVGIVVGEPELVGVVVDRDALAAEKQERREAGRAAAGPALKAPAD